MEDGRREGENISLCCCRGAIEEGGRSRLNRRSEIVSKRLSWDVV